MMAAAEERKIDRMGRDTEMLLNMDRDQNIDLIVQEESIFCRKHIAVGHRIQRGSPGSNTPLGEALSGLPVFPKERTSGDAKNIFCTYNH